jgi:hypothetical protein
MSEEEQAEPNDDDPDDMKAARRQCKAERHPLRRL